MTTVLDAGGVSALAQKRSWLQEMRDRGEWPPLVPSVVLTEALTGDHRRDFHENRLLRLCEVPAVDEVLARLSARLRTQARRRGASAVDAIVIALASTVPDPVVLTTDPADLRALAARSDAPVRVHSV